MEKRARPVKRPTSLDVKGIDKKIQKRPDSKKKKNVRDFVGLGMIVLFDDEGNWFWLNSATSDYSGEFDPITNETALWFPDTGSWEDWSPTSGEDFYLFRFTSWWDWSQPSVEEIDWQTAPAPIMTTADIDETNKAVTKKGKPRLQSTKPKNPYFENGKWKRPRTPEFMSKRHKVGDDDDVPVASYGCWTFDEYGILVLGTMYAEYDLDTDDYYIASSPVALSRYENYYAMDIEGYGSYYALCVQVLNSCSIGGAVSFTITGPGIVDSHYPLGRQLQAAIPHEAIHTGIRCSGCRKNGIAGIRYKCLECKDFNLCSKCEDAGVEPRGHSVNHNTLMIKVPRAVHVGVTCNKCKISPIEGARFKCQVCDDFDMCETCERKNEHPIDHPLVKARKPLIESD